MFVKDKAEKVMVLLMRLEQEKMMGLMGFYDSVEKSSQRIRKIKQQIINLGGDPDIEFTVIEPGKNRYALFDEGDTVKLNTELMTAEVKAEYLKVFGKLPTPENEHTITKVHARYYPKMYVFDNRPEMAFADYEFKYVRGGR